MRLYLEKHPLSALWVAVRSSAPGTGYLFMKLVCDTPSMIRVKPWEKNVGKASAILWSGISSPEISKACSILGPKLRGKKLIFSVQIFMCCDSSKLYKWGRIFLVKVDIRNSNFRGQAEKRRVKGEAWNVLDYSCASKFTLYFKATDNRNPIDKRRKKMFIFAPSILPFNSWSFEWILQ